MTMGASVLLIVASWDAEGDQAAAEPASDEAENQAKDPSESTLLLIHVSHAGVTAMLALNSDGVVWPMARWIRTSHVSLLIDDNNLGAWLLHHHGLTGLCHHWLSWSGLTHGSILWLAHWLWGVLRLLTNERLLFWHDLTSSGAIDILFSFHRELYVY